MAGEYGRERKKSERAKELGITRICLSIVLLVVLLIYEFGA